MTLFVIKETARDGKYRLYRENGEQISDIDWEEKPTRRDLSDALDSDHGGASVLAEQQARHEFLDLCMGDLVYHGNDDNLPWSEED